MNSFNFNQTDDSYIMYEKLNDYVSKIKKDKTTEILKLFNELFKKENKRLSNFKLINVFYFKDNKNIADLIKILELYEKKLKLDLNKIKTYRSQQVKYDSSDESSESDSEKSESSLSDKKKTNNKKKTQKDIDINKEIFSVLSKLLKTVQYKFKRTTLSNKSYYDVTFE